MRGLRRPAFAICLHNFNRPFEVIGPAWQFLREQRLDDDPVYTEVDVGSAPDQR